MRRLLDFLGTWGLAVVITAAGLWAAWQFVDPAPPRVLVLATGDAEGAYYAFGERYRALLAREGIEVELRETAGSPENRRLLADPESGVDIAFLQSGRRTPEDKNLQALASLYYEPMWLFANQPRPPLLFSDLPGLRFAAGEEDSGTRRVIERLMLNNGLEPGAVALVSAEPDESVSALVAGEVDVIALVTSQDSPAVKTLARTDGIELLGLARAPAYARLYPYLSSLSLPRGSLDLRRDVPGEDVQMLATTAMLAAREDLHPALVDLLLMAARKIHGPAGLFSDRDQFPSPDHASLPLSPEADRHFRYGAPFLMRHLPFWAATMVDRLKVMIVPILGLMLPLIKITPPLLRWRTRRRIFRWYKEVRAMDPDLSPPNDAGEARQRLEAIESIEHEVAREDVPLSYADELYQLRTHLGLVRIKLSRLDEAAGSEVPAAGDA